MSIIKKTHNDEGVGLLLGLILIALAVGIIAFAFANRSKQISLKQTSTTLKGFSLSPKSFEGQDFASFFSEAEDSGADVLTWAGDWSHLGDGNSGPKVTTQQAKAHGMLPIMIVTTHTETGQGKVKAIRDIPAYRQTYLNYIENYAKTEKPSYIGIGIEVNRIYVSSPEEFNQFVALFNDAVTKIKAVSVKTQVFSVFQLEQVKGLNGGLFGGQNDVSANQWHLLSQFESADFLAFTTYPGLIYKDPGEIPPDYYQEITARISKPIAFTEVGWPSATEAAGWESSPTEQVAFVNRFGELTKTLNPKLVVWPFLYDQDLKAPFTNLGLTNRQGSKKPALKAWQELLWP